jgi:2-(1,2-epoxy-1,2-dihydrophenyl)acetyl-CoA isomerase
MTISRLDADNRLFSACRTDDIVSLCFKEKPLLLSADLGEKKRLFDYLDLVADCSDVHVLLINESPRKMNQDEYTSFFHTIAERNILVQRMNIAVNQFILKLMALNQMVIHVDSGDVIIGYMNIGLACDYRIVADNTVFQNPNPRLGVIPKGGIAYLLSKMLGSVTASRILLSTEDIKAEDALVLKLVDQVVPMPELDTVVMETAQAFTRLSSAYTAGVKKLLNYNIKEVKDFLDYEDMQFCYSR